MTSVTERLSRGAGWNWRWPVAVGVIALASGRAAANTATLRVVMAGGILALMVGFAVRAPRKLLMGLAAWLVALGLLRRLATGLSAPGAADPLLLVGASALCVLTLAASQEGAFSNRSRLANLVLGLQVLIVLAAFNPLQESLFAGLSALLFLLVPTLAFWVGRALVDDGTLKRLLRLLAFLGLGAALYGLVQTFGTFPSWDQRWIEDSGYEALQISKEVVRPFGTSSSASEYTTVMLIGLVVCIGLGRRLGPILVRLSAVAVIAIAVFYSSSRGPVVIGVVTLALMAAVRRRLPIGIAALAGLAALVLLPVVVAFFAPANSEDDLVSHQIDGLLHPFDPERSTLGKHLDIIGEGLRSATHYPFGRGASIVNIAGQKFGTTTQNTESDLSNAAVAFGVPGLLVYGALVVGAFRLAFREATARQGLRLVALGVLLATVLQWLNGGQYAVAWLPWLALGWLDSTRQEQPSGDVEVEHSELSRPADLIPLSAQVPA